MADSGGNVGGIGLGGVLVIVGICSHYSGASGSA